jgi:hypothetical protein
LQLSDTFDRSGAISRNFIALIFSQCVELGFAEWSDKKSQTHILILWHSVSEWADLIVAWITEAGMNDTVLTGYEVRCGDLVTDKGMSLILFHAALQIV